MNAHNAASANDDARPDLASMLARLETEALHLCGLADALDVIAHTLSGMDGTEGIFAQRARNALQTIIDAMKERTDQNYEIAAQARLIAARAVKAAA
jgi:hypothetical protein